MGKGYKSLNVCMYCGSTENLTKEHIVNYGINGELTLKNSSCKSCNGITSRNEESVLRGQMGQARIVGGLRTRNPENRPDSIKINVSSVTGESEELDVPIKEATAFLHIPLFTEASFLSGGKRKAGAEVCGFDTLYFGENPKDFLLKENYHGITDRVRIDVHAFAKLLAKTAYAFYVAEKGLFPRSESPALALMNGELRDTSIWVGSSFQPLAKKTSELHQLETKVVKIRTGKEVEIVRVQLFAPAGTCIYEVVVRAAKWRLYLK
ncbi:hypothetical protein HS961_12730 [Comamonas piscis]|uniref:HNH endonuclease n=1 Tax=Comamonas piscis TaxID=1562974 RepID=A0A7G5EHZ9_9BURK|nr:hypothetical protein [Comamonas piscis]QMV73624.1 hypothetical protein HS961_12730 [Comamonas piscis]WSO32046.1 hypothetical protein VUJ63_12765 [Comamonas piscis]